MAWKRPWDLFRVSHHLRPLELSPSLLQLFQVPRQGAKQSWAEVPFLPSVLDGTFGSWRKEVMWEQQTGESCLHRTSPCSRLKTVPSPSRATLSF